MKETDLQRPISDLLRDIRIESPEEKRAFLRDLYDQAVESRDPWQIFQVVVDYYPLDSEGQLSREMIETGGKIIERIARRYEDDVGCPAKIALLLDLTVDYLLLPPKLLFQKKEGADFLDPLLGFRVWEENQTGRVLRDALEEVSRASADFSELPYFGAEYFKGVVFHKSRLERSRWKGEWNYSLIVHNIEEWAKKIHDFLEKKRRTTQDPHDFYRITRGFLYLGEEKDIEEARIAAKQGIEILKGADKTSFSQPSYIESAAGFLIVCSQFDYSKEGDLRLLTAARQTFGLMIDCLGKTKEVEDTSKKQLLKSRAEISQVLDKFRKREEKVLPKVIRALIEELGNLDKVLQEKGWLPKSAETQSLSAQITRRLTRPLALLGLTGGKVIETKPLSAGEKLKMKDGAKYLINQVFNGGQSVIYLTENEIGEQFALRLLSKDREEFDESCLRMLVSLRRNAPENIVPRIQRFYEIKRGAGQEKYLVTEWVEGESLAGRMEKGKLSEAETVIIARKVAEVLHYIHSAEIAHSDIKSSNIILQPNGGVVLIDWQLARNVGKPVSREGTLGYLPPEVLAQKPAMTESDIYSLGVTLAEMLTGRPQKVGVVGSSEMPLYNLSFEERFSGIGNVTKELRELIADCTKLQPEERPTAEQVLVRLNGIKFFTKG